ncbi:hypothetical protein LUW77_00615 [Streptomyces radiopugnans]|nr:hypothetical protein LUW77_00615 [Streptomyces radiopugnans]
MGHGEEEWVTVAGLGREAVARVCPAEEELFDAVLAEFRANPYAAAAGRRLRPPVGMGVDLALVTPQVLWLTSLLISAVAGRVADKAIDTLSQATRERTAALLHRRRSRTADSEEESQSTESGDNGSRSDGERPGLDAEELREIRQLLEAGAAALEIAEDRAQQIVTAVMNILESPAGGTT